MPLRRAGLTFVVLLGVVSLFADMTYEGARSAVGPFLGAMGASALTVSIVAGGGELVGYALRFWSGRLADRTRRYWSITFVGYTVNLLAVPLLALAGNWPVAAFLVVLERTGKAIRTPARDAMLSYATTTTGRGWGFGLHEALDQIGATVGPLIVTAVVLSTGSYRNGFAALLVPALVALSVLTAAQRIFPNPQKLERAEQPISGRGYSRSFWWYLAGCCLVAAGYADYPLLAYHFSHAGTISSSWIPALYALAMGVDAVAAVVFGRWFDRASLRVLVISTTVSAPFALLAFAGTTSFVVIGIVLWGIGLGAQESIMRAAIAEMTAADRRASAYGLFNFAYGVAWFGGSVLLGWLYGHSLQALIGVSVTAQLLAAIVFVSTTTE